jgi:threonine 3-dehydrogenase
MSGPLSEKRYCNEIILGHSFSGIIEKTGQKTKGFRKGDKIFASDFVWCGKCQNCLNGEENLCDGRYVFGMEKPGSNAEYVSVPIRACFHLPNSVDFLQGSLICDVLALVCHSIKKANLSKKDHILIIGAGPIGLCLSLLLKSYGFKNFAVIEKVKERKDIGEKTLGMKIYTANKFENKKDEFDAVFDVSGDKRALELGFKTLKRGGKLVMIGVQSEPFLLNSLKWLSRELTLFGIFDFNSGDIKEALKLVKNKKINLNKLITHRFSLDNGEKAYDLLQSKKTGKIILLN